MNEQERLNALTQPLLLWYDLHRRDLPWRRDREAYHIWVSEIMLQQTRVEAVRDYYMRFLAAFPTVFDLAAASEDTLLKLWEGLGYYSRARSLHRAAKQLVQERGGVFPETADELRSLPGIGDYTASAIASIAFGRAEPAVDGNLLRVSARITGVAEDVTDIRVRRKFRAMLCAAIPPERPGEYNQAMMDLGATVCLPNGAPRCGLCPGRGVCEAYRQGMTERLPVRGAKKARRSEELTVFVLQSPQGRVALRKRPDTGLLAAMWELPNCPGDLDSAAAALALGTWWLAAESIVPAGTAKHIFTHVEWAMRGYLCRVTEENEAFLWADAATLASAAIPSAFRKYSALARDILGGSNGTALL